MLPKIKGYLKFFVKVRVIAKIRAWLIYFFGNPVNKSSWENRILLVHLEGLGDSVALTSVLKHYREDFPGKEIYMLVDKSSSFDDPAVFGGIIKRLVLVDYRRFVKNPFYGLSFINELRKIGFKKVVTHDPSLAEISGKFIMISLCAEDVVGYDGALFQRVTPFDENMHQSIAYVRKNLLPHFTKIIESADKDFDFRVQKPLNYISHFIKSYENFSGRSHRDYSPKIFSPPYAESSILKILEKNKISPGSYCLLSLSTSTPKREWPAERFAKVLLKLKSSSLPLVIAGGKRDALLVKRFQKVYSGNFLNLAGKTSVSEYISLVKNSFFSFSNETAQAHIAIALKKPSLTILGGGHFGLLSLYGYLDINRWLYHKKVSCLYDNWRCVHTVGPNEPAPCIDVITENDVAQELESFISYLHKEKNYPRETFQIKII